MISISAVSKTEKHAILNLYYFTDGFNTLKEILAKGLIFFSKYMQFYPEIVEVSKGNIVHFFHITVVNLAVCGIGFCVFFQKNIPNQ